MDPFWLQPQFFFLPFIVLAIGMLTFVRARLRAKIAPLGEVLDGQTGDLTGPVAPTLAGRFKGREASFVLTHGGRNSPPKFSINIACRGSMLFDIYREDIGSRFAKKLHLLADVEIGDADLDAKLVFSCKEPDPFTRWMAGAEVKRCVSSLLLGRGVDRLSLENGRLRATQFRHGRADLEPSRVREVLDEMESLVRPLEDAT
jgi:hypothetical protein